MPDLWTLTCAPASRAIEVQLLFDRVGFEDKCVVVTTQPDPIRYSDGNHLLLFDDTEINISKWWTLGLDYIDRMNEGNPDPYDILVIESDGRMSFEDVDFTRKVMREENCVMAGADWHHILPEGQHKVRRDNSRWIGSTGRADQSRLPGMALVVAGEAHLRHDPEFRWWLADDDFEWTARVNGGTVLVSGPNFYHEGTQGPLTGERLKAFREDEGKFLRKWGGLPDRGGIIS